VSRKFTKSFEELRTTLAPIGSEWDETEAGKKVLRKNGGLLNWLPSTGSLQFQGKPEAKDEAIGKTRPWPLSIPGTSAQAKTRADARS
jgi:hypothetical protein